MATNIVKIFPAYVFGRNSLEQLLAEKRKMLETYQTPRTAKEFYEAVKETFSKVSCPMKRGFFTDKEYQLVFQEQPYEFLILYLEPNGSDTAIHQKDNQEIIVTARPAFAIPGLRKDILLGRNDPLDKMPTGVKINDKVYTLNYGYSAQGPMRGKLS